MGTEPGEDAQVVFLVDRPSGESMRIERKVPVHRRRSHRAMLALAALATLPLGACHSSDELLVGVSIAAFRPGTMPPGMKNVTAAVLEAATGALPTDATVTVNGVALVRKADGEFEGTVNIGPGEAITLVASGRGSTVRYSTTAFASFPALTSPRPGNLPVFCTTVLTWSPGTTTSGSTYGLGVLDAANPNGGLIWPNADLAQIPLGTTSYTIPGPTLPEGDRFILLGLVDQTGIPGAAKDSVFILGGFDAVRVQITTTADLTSIALSPPSATIPSGALLGMTALGGYCDATHGDVTGLADWTSSSTGVVQLDAGVGSLVAAAVGAGSSTVTATSGSISGSAVVEVRGALSEPGAGSTLNAVAAGPLLVAGGEGGLILTSPDALTWTSRASGTAAAIRGLVWSGAKFVAVGDTGLILTSPDGATWTARTSGTAGSIRAVTWTGTFFVAVGDGGLVLTSPDGVTWAAQSSGIAAALWAVAWSGSRLVAVGDVDRAGGYLSTTLLTSPDGISWTRQSGPTGGLWGLTGLAASGSRVVATSDQGDLLTSADGTSWTVVGTGLQPGNQLLGATWTGTRFAVVGMDGVMLGSDDGASWAPLLTPGWTSPDLGAVSLRAVTPLGDQLLSVGSGGAVVTSL